MRKREASRGSADRRGTFRSVIVPRNIAASRTTGSCVPSPSASCETSRARSENARSPASSRGTRSAAPFGYPWPLNRSADAGPSRSPHGYPRQTYGKILL